MTLKFDVTKSATAPGSHSAAAIADFLRRLLSTGAVGVIELEAKADGDRQITGSEAPGRRIPPGRIDGVASLDDITSTERGPSPPMAAFLTANWAERAASLGWNALDLFGCHSSFPLDHLGSAGLLCTIEGDALVKLHSDCAVIEEAHDGPRRVYRRRRLDAANVTLPWLRLRRGVR